MHIHAINEQNRNLMIAKKELLGFGFSLPLYLLSHQVSYLSDLISRFHLCCKKLFHEADHWCCLDKVF